MGTSIGELFVSLGFDVDDSKLKSFDQGIRSAVGSVASLAGISALTVGGLGYFGSQIADQSLKIKNFADANHLSAEGLLRWQAILRQTTGAGADEAFASYKRLNDYLTSLSNGGYAGLMNQLGARYSVGMSVDQLNDSISEALPALIATHRYTPQQINSMLTQMGYVENSQAFLLKSKAERDALASTSMTGVDNEANARLSLQIKELSRQWDTFVNHIVATLAPETTSLLKTLNEKGVWATIDQIGANDSGWIDWVTQKMIGGGHAVAKKVDESLHPEDHAISFLRSQGWSYAQASGMVARLMKESGLDTSAVGDSGKAYGIAQWHPDRQANFAKWAGHSILNSTIDEQLGFVNYELTKGMERKAGDKLRQTRSAGEAEDSFTKNYERPKIVNQNVTQHIHSTAPAKDVANEVTNNLQRQLSTAFTTANRGPVQ